jgi:hypothetical protein
MTNKIYKTAQGQSIDLGAIILKNEHVRAVGNMNVNARGDRLDGAGQVVDQKNKQVTRQHERTTRPGSFTPVSTQPLHTSSLDAKQRKTPQPEPEPEVLAQPPITADVAQGGLAAAISRSKNIADEKTKTQESTDQPQPGTTKP